MFTIRELLGKAIEQLASVAGHPVLEAEILLASTLNKPRAYLHAWPEKEVTQADSNRLTALLTRRLHGEPIAYITGVREFWSLAFAVNSDTLIPRPETEMLVERVLAMSQQKAAISKVADLGTGCGAIAVSLAYERPTWEIYATDINKKTLQIAKQNAASAKLQNISFCEGNWCHALPCADFDLIVSNPPYLAETEWAQYKEGLKFEPKEALVSGRDGLDAIREISQSAKQYLKKGGALLFEHGFLQGDAVRNILLAAGYAEICSKRDLAGWERITIARSY